MAADFALVGSSIRTLDPERPHATAVAIEDGIITAVGDDADIRAACDATTQIVNGDGMHVVPGLTDSHFHPFWGTRATRGVDLTGAQTLDDLRALIAAERQRIGPDEWVIGWGLTFEMFQRTGIRGDLFAEAAGGGLAYLGFFDGHTAVASPAAFAYCDVTGKETFEDFSTVVVDQHGVPTGELRENGAMNLITAHIPQPTPEQLYAMTIANMKRWNALGLTGLHVMVGNAEIYDLARQIEGNGDLTVRMIIPIWNQPDLDLDEMRKLTELRDVHGRRWRGGTAKFFIDGVVESGTAWLLEPDATGENNLPFWPDPAKYTAAIDIYAKAGFQCITHAVGDRAVRHALDAYEASGAAPGIHHRIEHIELLHDDDVPRFAKLGVAASMQPLHMNAFEANGTDQWSSRVGPERRKRAFRTRDLRDSGAILALGSDWMVAPYDPRIGMAWAALRRRPGDKARGQIQPEQALTRIEVLEGYTTEAAKTVSEAHVAGLIKPGYRGDLSCFAADIVECDADELLSVPCQLTVVDGQVVHRAEA